MTSEAIGALNALETMEAAGARGGITEEEREEREGKVERGRGRKRNVSGDITPTASGSASPMIISRVPSAASAGGEDGREGHSADSPCSAGGGSSCYAGGSSASLISVESSGISPFESGRAASADVSNEFESPHKAPWQGRSRSSQKSASQTAAPFWRASEDGFSRPITTATGSTARGGDCFVREERLQEEHAQGRDSRMAALMRQLTGLAASVQVDPALLDLGQGDRREGDQGPTVIGEGSGGVVYRAVYDGKPVAVKVLEVTQASDSGAGVFLFPAGSAGSRIAARDYATHSPRHVRAPSATSKAVSPIDVEQQLSDLMTELRVGLLLPPHPRLVQLVGAAVSASDAALVFDLVDGLDSEALFRSKRTARANFRPDVAQVLHWAAQLFDVLAFLHSRAPPLVHRDVKPENIIILHDLKSIKLIDFGLVSGLPDLPPSPCSAVAATAARPRRPSCATPPTAWRGGSSEVERGPGGAAAGAATGTLGSLAETYPMRAHAPGGGDRGDGRRGKSDVDRQERVLTGKVGSYRYMAPEVVQERCHYDGKADVYSATMVLWFWLSGEAPFNGIAGDLVALMAAGENLRPSLKNIKIPKLADLLQRGWEAQDVVRASALDMHQSTLAIQAQLPEAGLGSLAGASVKRGFDSMRRTLRPVSKALSALTRAVTRTSARGTKAGMAAGIPPRTMTGDFSVGVGSHLESQPSQPCAEGQGLDAGDGDDDMMAGQGGVLPGGTRRTGGGTQNRTLTF